MSHFAIPDPGPLDTVAQIRAALRSAERAVGAFFGTLSDADLFHRVPGQWSPMDDLRHITRTAGGLARGLEKPKLLLRLRFGRAKAPAASYVELARRGMAALEGGFVAVPAHVPAAEEVVDRASYREDKLHNWAAANADLQAALGGWSDRQIDHIMLPHPALGRLSVREMLYNAHMHHFHHIDVARLRVADRAAS
jgi:hypothetical protein